MATASPPPILPSEETQPSLRRFINYFSIFTHVTVTKPLKENQNAAKEISDLKASLEMSDQELAKVREEDCCYR